MKTSLKWLREYIAIPWTAEELAERLTMTGLEVEGLDKIGDLPPEVVVGQIKSRRPHPDADRLSLCEVDDGSGSLLPVVCGAPNCDAGQKAPFARIGAKLAPDFEIAKRKVRGEVSCGMLCAPDELGLGESHDGLLILPADAPVGQPLRDYLGVDATIDWEVTPNRPDCLSHLGIAREIGALTGGTVQRPEPQLAEDLATPVTALAAVEVRAPDLCPRYTARVIRGVKIGPSPKWLADRLRAIGLRPINNVVDVTNYVLYECGQPLHAFDYDKLAGHRIVVRRAAPGERLRTLDGQEQQLGPEHLVIADAAKPVALAGIMGGLESEIAPDTVNVLLESAVFAPGNIRATAKRLGTASDSSYRFERGVDVEGAAWASARAVQLICELAGGRLAGGMIDQRAGPFVPPRLECRYQRVRELLGVAIADAEQRRILQRLGLTIVAEAADRFTVHVPSFRPDLEREADLIEEIGRIYGLDRIPAAKGSAQLGGPRAADAAYRYQELREQLLGLGLDECLTYSMVNKGEALKVAGEKELLELKNPLTTDFTVLRPNLLTGMLQSLAHNVAHGNHQLRLFELGIAYNAGGQVPEEQYQICFALSGLRHPERFSGELEAEYDYYDLRGLVEELLASRKVTAWQIAPAQHPHWDGKLCAALSIGGRPAGTLGRVAPGLVGGMRLRHPLYLALLDVPALFAVVRPPFTVVPAPQFPGTSRDIAFLAPEALRHEQVLAAVANAKVPFLESVSLFDIFRDAERLGQGRKSMAYSFAFRAADRTLTDKEVNKAHESLRAQLAQELGVELR